MSKKHTTPLPRYFPAAGWSGREIKAALKRGSIKPWKVDAVGQQWYERQPPRVIHAALPDAIEAEAEADDAYDMPPEIDAERANWRYEKLVEARASGTDIPPQLGEEVLRAANKSMQQFEEDIAFMLGLEIDDSYDD